MSTQTDAPILSLCMIVGNEAAVIERCLDAFAPAFDELCLVRAIGVQDPDATIDLARAWCRLHMKSFHWAEHTNAQGGPHEWDHIDDFGAARQSAFELATGEWIFWADADDVVHPGTSIAHLRTLAAEHSAEVDCWLCPYEVPGTNKAPMRERLVRRGAGWRWRWPIHENMSLPKGARVRSSSEPVWLHAPLGAKQSSAGRNLRILDASLKDVPTQLYYVHQEHFLVGSRDTARQWGEVALSFPQQHPHFRYEIHCNLAKLSPDKHAGLDHFARAHAVLPQCREAVAGMTLVCMELGDLPRADALSAQLIAMPEPPTEQRPWSHEAKWYGWAAVDLRARVLRLLDRATQAEDLEASSGWARPKISLIHATRGRNQRAWTAREAWLGLAADPLQVEHIYVVDADDTPAVQFAKQFRHVVVGETRGGCVRAWNLGAQIARGQVLVQLSDDWRPCWGWDRMVLEALGDLDAPKVLAVSDGHRKDELLCMAICTRARWEQQGRELFHSGYRSVYSDNEFSARAWADGVVVDARERIEFVHEHPLHGHGQWDETYNQSNSPERYAEGKALFEARNPGAAAGAGQVLQSPVG